jgi:hypothetical protein
VDAPDKPGAGAERVYRRCPVGSAHYFLDIGISGRGRIGNQIVLVAEDAANKIPEFDTDGNLLKTVFPTGRLCPATRPPTRTNIYIADYAHDGSQS